jgi:hypothetical protein
MTRTIPRYLLVFDLACPDCGLGKQDGTLRKVKISLRSACAAKR